jgi:hypothetical protein
MDFQTAVRDQITLLNEGEPLQAFDRYFDDDGVMYDNDEVVGTGKAACREKHDASTSNASIILGNITSFAADIEDEICVFRNQTTYIDDEGTETHLDRIHWQRWENGMIVEERCYRDEMMAEKIAAGILDQAVPSATEELQSLDPRASAEADAMRGPVLSALDALVKKEQVEIIANQMNAVADELILAGLEAHNPRHALKKLRLALIHSDNVEEVYASDLELEAAFRAAMGG